MAPSHPFSHLSHVTFSPTQHHPTVKSTSGQILVIDAQTGQTAFDFKNTEDAKGSNLHYS
ncbi:MAG: hypothetical protein WAO08_14860 [Hyphomicrobiaceae bacterium]